MTTLVTTPQQIDGKVCVRFDPSTFAQQSKSQAMWRMDWFKVMPMELALTPMDTNAGGALLLEGMILASSMRNRGVHQAHTCSYAQVKTPNTFWLRLG